MVAGALFYTGSAGAQVLGPPASEVPLPTKPKTDSARDTTRIKTDTIKPPIGRFVDPRSIDQDRTEWNREELFASGALTLVDLLDHVPEVNTFRSGWIATPQIGTYNGDAKKVRVFYDDIEMDPLSGREGGILDLSAVQLWTLERVTLERSPTELRIYLRSWRVERTTAYTRTDILTGNENTNLYRGYYGKRYGRGQVLQLAAQQYGTSSTRTAGTGDQLSLLARVGIGRKNWSVDAFANRTHPDRSTQSPLTDQPAIPPWNATETIAYLRAGIGNADLGPWLQVTGASLQLREASPHTQGTAGASTTSSGIAVPRDTADSTRSETQLNVTGGFSLGPGRLTLQERYRAIDKLRYFGPIGRFELGSGPNVLSAFTEWDALRSLTTTDLSAHVQPLSFIAFSAGAGRRTSSLAGSGVPALTSFRGSGSIRLRRLWLTGAVISSDTSTRAAPIVFDTGFVATTVGRSTGVTTSLRGPLWRGIGIDSWVTHWSNATAYQPRYHTRVELNYFNDFLGRFPSGDFSIKALALMEYRSRVAFPTSSGVVGSTSSHVLGGLIEIRILRAVVSYQQRNILALPYDVVPGFQMSRVLAIYGVRWEFWN